MLLSVQNLLRDPVFLTAGKRGIYGRDGHGLIKEMGPTSVACWEILARILGEAIGH